MRLNPIPDLSAKREERLCQRIEIDDETECWEWIGHCKDQTPYTTIKGRQCSVRRVLASLKGLDRYDGLWHPTCGNVRCVNLKHCEFREFKLDADDVLDILTSPEPKLQVAKRLGISPTTIYEVLQGTIHHTDRFGNAKASLPLPVFG